jgi:predicted GNAT superfamily acetyltransferase
LARRASRALPNPAVLDQGGAMTPLATAWPTWCAATRCPTEKSRADFDERKAIWNTTCMKSTRRGSATNTPEPEILIRPAQESDISSMLEIAQQRALEGSQENASKNGFLVSNFSRDDYCELLQRAEYLYVAAIHSEVVGFVIAYSRDRIGEDEWLNMQMIDNFHNFTVIKQVGVSKAHSGKSIATRLYERILERAGSGTVIAAVVSDPPNRPSEALHRKMGFQPLTTLTPPDGIPRTVWVRQPVDTKLLESQLSLALDLYKHEDILNWQKLNNFFYISAGLLALCGFSLNQDTQHRRIILVSASIVGIIISLAFFIMLRAGISYLQSRKTAVAFLERNLLGQRGCTIFYGRDISMKKQLQRSPTTIVLQQIPLIGAIGWLILLLFGFISII